MSLWEAPERREVLLRRTLEASQGKSDGTGGYKSSLNGNTLADATYDTDRDWET